MKISNLETYALNAIFGTYLKGLSYSEREVLKLRGGFAGKAHTREEVAQQLKLPEMVQLKDTEGPAGTPVMIPRAEKIEWIEDKAMDKLRRMSSIKPEYLDDLQAILDGKRAEVAQSSPSFEIGF